MKENAEQPELVDRWLSTVTMLVCYAAAIADSPPLSDERTIVLRRAIVLRDSYQREPRIVARTLDDQALVVLLVCEERAAGRTPREVARSWNRSTQWVIDTERRLSVYRTLGLERGVNNRFAQRLARLACSLGLEHLVIDLVTKADDGTQQIER